MDGVGVGEGVGWRRGGVGEAHGQEKDVFCSV